MSQSTPRGTVTPGKPHFGVRLSAISCNGLSQLLLLLLLPHRYSIDSTYHMPVYTFRYIIMWVHISSCHMGGEVYIYIFFSSPRHGSFSGACLLFSILSREGGFGDPFHSSLTMKSHFVYPRQRRSSSLFTPHPVRRIFCVSPRLFFLPCRSVSAGLRLVLLGLLSAPVHTGSCPQSL